jgi:hypothetical protein
VESTDTSKFRSSNQTRQSRSCIPSPREDPFRREVDRYLNGYSGVFSKDEVQELDFEERQGRYYENPEDKARVIEIFCDDDLLSCGKVEM